MFKRKKKKTGVQTPEFRKPTPPPPPTSGSNAVRPNPNYVPPASVKPTKEHCPYETPCGWCSKWDKKCDNKIGCEKSDEPIIVSNYVSPAMQAMFKGERYDDTIKIHFEGELNNDQSRHN